MVVPGRILVGAVLLWCLLPQPGVAADCGAKRYCGDMANCAEAAHYLRDCGLRRLDGDGDGIPCETLCGKSVETFQRRFGKQSRRSLTPVIPECGAKHTCGEMDDCAEARFYLNRCDLRSLDRDRDGIPCEGLCR